MANYNKSFNFRNGVQVDNDNFIVNANGLVGIGTTLLKDYILNVFGDVRIVGLLSATEIKTENLSISGISSFTTLNVGITSITSGIVTASSGIVTYYGDGSKLSNLSTSQWIDVNTGIGVSSIYAAGNVGIATTSPTFTFQVGPNPLVYSTGIGINSTGDVYTNGIVTAVSFSGSGSNLTTLNASNISSGTISTSRFPSNIILSGIITASSFVGSGASLTSLNASNITSGTLSTSRLPSNIVVSGIITASSFVGNLTGTASTANSLSSGGSITVGSVNSGFTSTGISTVTDTLYVLGKIGVGTNTTPGADIEVLKSGISSIRVISNNNVSTIGIGRSAEIRTGNTDTFYLYSTPSSLDIINSNTGNVNYYLDYGSAGLGTGAFHWIYGQNPSNPLMSLTYDGKLGLGITNPTAKLYVVGSSYITGITTIASNLNVSNNLNVTGNISFDGSLTGNLGITTLARLGISTSTISSNSYEFFVGGDPVFGPGVAITASGIRASGIIQASDLTSTNATITNINSTGIITANSFRGDGSQLTGITGSGIVIEDDGSLVGTATTINFGANLTVSPVSAGLVTVTASGGGGGESYWVSTLSGIHTTSSVGIGTTDPTEKLTVFGDARVTGILTVGTASITLDGTTNIINVGSGVTIDGSTGIIEASSIVIGETTITGADALEISGVLGFGSRNNILIGDSTTGCLLINGSGENNFFAGSGAGRSTTDSEGASNNNFIGYQAGYYNTFGYYNNFFGRYAGRSNTFGSNNNFFGSDAGFSNTEGSYNNFFGHCAGFSNTFGSYNNFLGGRAGFANTTGSGNIFFGGSAGHNNTEGSSNIFFGNSAGYYNTTGNYNILFGFNAGSAPERGTDYTANCNIIFGYFSGTSITTGSSNIFFGSYVGCNNTTGNNNTFLGSYSGISTSASNKIIFGSGFDSSNLFDSPDTTKDTQFAVGVRTDANDSKYWLVGDENFNIGIGTTNPVTKLEVSGNSPTLRISGISSSTTRLDLSSTGGIKWSLVGNPLGSNGALTIQANDIEFIRVSNNTGNLGIGTTDPTSKLTVVGDVLVSGVVTATSFVGDGSGLTNLPSGGGIDPVIASFIF